MLTTAKGEAICPLGLAGNHDMVPGCVPVALVGGVNAFFFYNLDFEPLIGELAEAVGAQRDTMFVATGTEDRDPGEIKTYFEHARKKLDTDFLDVFFMEYVSPREDFERVGVGLDLLNYWKKVGKIRYVGASVHDRTLAIELMRSGQIDVLMHRYNMAHRKSEDEVLPFAVQSHIPIVSFTNTRWGSLLKGHERWTGQVPTAVDCYRFVLRHAAVKLAWTSPQSPEQLRENLAVLKAPRMLGDEVAQWKAYGDLIYGNGQDAFETRWP